MKGDKESIIKRLEELDLTDEYESGKLTINRLTYKLEIPFAKVEKKLYTLGYHGSVLLSTLVDEKWLPVIIGLNEINVKRISEKKYQKSRILKARISQAWAQSQRISFLGIIGKREDRNS